MVCKPICCGTHLALLCAFSGVCVWYSYTHLLAICVLAAGSLPQAVQLQGVNLVHDKGGGGTAVALVHQLPRQHAKGIALLQVQLKAVAVAADDLRGLELG